MGLIGRLLPNHKAVNPRLLLAFNLNLLQASKFFLLQSRNDSSLSPLLQYHIASSVEGRMSNIFGSSRLDKLQFFTTATATAAVFYSPFL
jgi:hypothetical protein